jgi:thioredoxin reductase (NADPH)
MSAIMVYDIAIVGGGPAGLAAAVNARRRNKETLLVSKETMSSKLVQAEQIENYLGIPQISGSELIGRMRNHAEAEGVINLKDEVQNIYQEDRLFSLIGRENAFQAKTVVLAPGISTTAEIVGEADFVGRGVSYCATCDGMFFKGKAVAMIGYIPEAESEAAFLSEICAQVHYFPQYNLATELGPKVNVVHGKPQKILGRDKVERLITSAGEFEVSGIFIERAGRPANELLDGLQIENGFIRVDFAQATNLPGVFAAGDCTGKPWQISRAVGQGQVAALSAAHFLNDNQD